jgi:uncharacterized cupredoxin-like copper-binding protein
MRINAALSGHMLPRVVADHMPGLSFVHPYTLVVRQRTRPNESGRSRWPLRHLLAAVFLLTAGCSSTNQSGTTQSLADQPDLTVSMFEWGFGPSTMSLDAESNVTVEFRNDGSLLHEWAVLARPIEVETDFVRDAVIASISVEPGAVTVLQFATPGPGTYQIICPISGHLSQGMEGELIVAP